MIQSVKNKLKPVLFTFLLIAFVAAVPEGVVAQTSEVGTIDDYKIYQSVRVKSGRLELLGDVRITDDIHVWDTDGYPPRVDDSEDEKIKEMFKKTPPRRTILRLTDARGKLLDTLVLKCVKADIKAVRLYSSAAKLSYQITCNFQSFAPYNGEVVSFVEIENGRSLRRLEAVDKKTGKKEEMEFVYSHRCGWEFTGLARGKGRDILRVYTLPDGEDGGGFLVRYERFHFDGKRWVRYEKKVKEDYWEDEFGFPKRSLFPKAI